MQLVVVAAYGYRYQFGFDLVALQVVADYGYRLLFGFVPVALQVVRRLRLPLLFRPAGAHVRLHARPALGVEHP